LLLEFFAQLADGGEAVIDMKRLFGLFGVLAQLKASRIEGVALRTASSRARRQARA